MSNTPIADYRDQLIAAQRELIIEMRKIIDPINKIASALDYEATRLLPHIEAGRSKVTATELDVREVEASGKAPQASALAPGKRGCGICGKPGHRRHTCPDADKDYKAQRAERKPRKPMSEARKQQLVETLKKARAARGQK